MSKGFLAATALTLAAGVFACSPKEPPEKARARVIVAEVVAKRPDAAIGKVWANGEWTCGRFTEKGAAGGAEKGFLGSSVDILWIEGPDTQPYYGNAWAAHCSTPGPALF